MPFVAGSLLFPCHPWPGAVKRYGLWSGRRGRYRPGYRPDTRDAGCLGLSATSGQDGQRVWRLKTGVRDSTVDTGHPDTYLRLKLHSTFSLSLLAAYSLTIPAPTTLQGDEDPGHESSVVRRLPIPSQGRVRLARPGSTRSGCSLFQSLVQRGLECGSQIKGCSAPGSNPDESLVQQLQITAESRIVPCRVQFAYALRRWAETGC